jgi:hypothetical protein
MHRIDTSKSSAASSSEDNSQRLRYFQFIISEANLKLTAEQGKLVFVKTIFDLHLYLEKNPEATRLGFIVEKPDCIKSSSMDTADTHVSPIYFERTQKCETFVQFDSALGQFFLLVNNKKLAQRLFYSPHLRQARRQGCFEDAVLILMKLLRAQGLISFCEKNCSDNSALFSKPLSEAETREQAEMEKLTSTSGLPYYLAAKFTQLARRLEYQKQLTALNEKGLTPIQALYTLNTLPKILIPHIERFDTMRNIRVRETEQFAKRFASGQTLLEVTLQKGVLRDSTVSKADILANLSDSNSKFDFAGRNFALQREELRQAQVSQSKNVYRLFYKKTASARIANRIAEFATGLRPE